jgi:formylglycine-generating enzyme required for sulfatase activity
MRVFISCVSSEFSVHRSAIASDLRAVGHSVATQEDFQQQGVELVEKLQRYIESCDRVIFLIGSQYGASPKHIEKPDWSFSQWEFHIANGYRLGGVTGAKKVLSYIYFSRQPSTETPIEQPIDRETILQSAHRNSIVESGADYTEFQTVDEVCRHILRDGFNAESPRMIGPVQRAYLSHLTQRLGRVSLDGPESLVNPEVTSGIEAEASLSELYLHPKVRRLFGFGAGKQSHEIGETERDIVKATESNSDAVVILGQPGAGKSVAARWLAITAATRCLNGESGTIPILVELGDVRFHELNTLDDLIRLAVSKGESYLKVQETCQWIESERSNLMIILDGLDEVAWSARNAANNEQGLHKLYEILKGARQSYPEQSLLLTCRTQDYQFDKSLNFPGAVLLVIPELSVQQVHEILRRRQDIMVEKGLIALSQADSNYDAMISALGNSAQLASFVTNPRCLQLFQLASINQAVSSSVPSIVWNATNMLLFRSESVQGNYKDVWARREKDEVKYNLRTDCLLTLGHIAKYCLDLDLSRGSILVPFEKLRSIAADILKSGKPSEYSLNADRADKVVRHLIGGHGVLINLNDESFAFSQDVFRDTLACHFLKELELDELIEISKRESWATALRYFAMLKASDKQSRGQVLSDAAELFSAFSETGSVPQLRAAGEFFAAQMTRYERFDGPKVFKKTLDDIRSTIETRLFHPQTVEADRVALGELLGRLGDRRIPSEHNAGSSKDRFFVSCSASNITLGGGLIGTIDHPKYRIARSDRVEGFSIEPFYLSRNVVSNIEFGKFIFDGGYEDPELWDEGLPRKWAMQDPETIEQLVAHMQGSGDLHLYTNFSLGRLTQPEVLQTLRKMVFRREPLFWYDDRYNKPSQPLVGVNYWEARAYARWCGKGLLFPDMIENFTFDLPSEYEWETAAQMYYSSSISANECYWNRFGEGGTGSAPVGLFPKSMVDANGPFDMIGNVWEWTKSLNGKFGEIENPEGVGESALNERIVRGGSWLSASPATSNICVRSFDPPCNAYEDLGFRIVARKRGDGA